MQMRIEQKATKTTKKTGPFDSALGFFSLLLILLPATFGVLYVHTFGVSVVDSDASAGIGIQVTPRALIEAGGTYSRARFRQGEVFLGRDLASTPDYSDEVAARMGELGWYGLTIPEEYGGGGADTLSFATGATPEPSFRLLVGLCAMPAPARTCRLRHMVAWRFVTRFRSTASTRSRFG